MLVNLRNGEVNALLALIAANKDKAPALTVLDLVGAYYELEGARRRAAELAEELDDAEAELDGC